MAVVEVVKRLRVEINIQRMKGPKKPEVDL